MKIAKFNIHGFDLYGKTSGSVKTKCVFCHDYRKHKNDLSLSVDIDKGVFKCHNCKISGTLNEIEYIYKKQTYEVPAEIKIELSQHIIDYFSERGISHETLRKAKVTSKDEFFPQIGKETKCICFNYYRNKELVNIKFRDKEKNFKLFKGAEIIPYNIDSIYKTNSVIITEGEIDCLSYIEAGLENVISVPNGANADIKYFDNVINYFTDKINIYIAVDNDVPGLNLRDRISARFGIEKCFKVDFNDCKDANEYLLKYGKQALVETITNAKRFPIKGVVTLNDIREEILDIYQNGIDQGMTLEISGLDNFIRWQLGRLLVVTGIPSHGKSEFIDFLVSKFMIYHGYKIAYFSPENYPLKLHYAKISEKITGKSLNQLTMDEFNDCFNYLVEHIFFIKPDNGEYTLENIFTETKSLIFRHNIKILVIDPWNRIEHQMGSESETTYINKMLTKIINFAQENHILVIIAAHPRKMQKKKNSTEYEIPSLYDISGSAHFYNKTDYGICVYRNFTEETTEIYVQKVKFRHLGKIGDISFKYNEANGRYSLSDISGTTYDNTNYINQEEKTEINEEQLPF